MNPTAAREELCGFIYKTAEPNNPLGLLQEALRLAPVCEAIEKRIRVEGVKTGRVTALDAPGPDRASPRHGHHLGDRGGRPARL